MNNEQLIIKIKELLNQVNQECFAGELVFNFPIKIVNTSRAAAYVSFKGIGFLGQRNYYTSFLGVSKNFVWDEESLKNVIAHELIHVYEVQVLKIKPSHGIRFKLKMSEINQKNPSYKVTLKHSMKTTKERKSKKVAYVLSEDKTKIAFITDTVLSKVVNNEGLYQQYFGKFTIGAVSSDKISRFRVSRKFKYYQLSQSRISEILG